MRIDIKLGDELKYLLFDWPLAVAEPKPAGSRRNRLLSNGIIAVNEEGKLLNSAEIHAFIAPLKLRLLT